MTEIIFFSNNQNKINEILKLFKGSALKIFNLNDFTKINSPKEIGSTFEVNAKIKSLFGFKRFNKFCFADDSGICIEAMNGGPGVESKDYLILNNSPKENLENIIEITKNKNNFSCYFQTTISLTTNINESIYFTGKIKGVVSKKIKGSNGFGYDPIFIPEGHHLTFGEMAPKEKNKISHRSIAINKLKEYINLIY